MTRRHTTGGLADRLSYYREYDTNGGCWLWSGCLTGGYGVLNYQGARRRVHRLVWESVRGPIPDGFEICHRCDVRACSNPEHLFVGTRSDNMRDCSQKGRLRVPNLAGDACGKASISWAVARAIRNDTGATVVEIAKRHGVSATIASRIRRNKTWRIERDPMGSAAQL